MNVANYSPLSWVTGSGSESNYGSEFDEDSAYDYDSGSDYDSGETSTDEGSSKENIPPSFHRNREASDQFELDGAASATTDFSSSQTLENPTYPYGIERDLVLDDITKIATRGYLTNRKEKKKSATYTLNHLTINKTVIGQGSFSKVRSIVSPEVYHNCIIKQSVSKMKTGWTTISCVAWDYINHMNITKNRKIWGIQNPPKTVFVIFKEGNLPYKISYVCDKYDSDLNQVYIEKSKLSLDDKLLIIEQILSALVFYEERHLFDYDRKSQNFLFKRVQIEDTSFPLAHFSDFGSTESVDNWNASQSLIASSVCKHELELERFSNMKFEADHEAYRAAAMQLPIFGYGITLYRLLDDATPFEHFCVRSGFSGKYTEITNDEIPGEIKELIRSMLDITKIRSGKIIKDQFMTYLERHRSDLLTRIQHAKTHLGYED